MLTLPGGRPPAPRGRVGRALAFVRPYVAAASGALRLFAIGWTRRPHRAQIVELASRFGYAHTSREPMELPTVAVEDAAPADGPLEIREISAVDGNVSERELIVICRIARAVAPRRVFEFGTFDGRTALNLAANGPPGCRVHTLDLPSSAIAGTAAPIDPGERHFVEKATSGARFHGSDLEASIVQLFGDSGTFDFTPYHATMDLIFVDASHTYEYVVNDSLHAMLMLAPTGGTILWHDYARWDGVTRALNELRRLDARFAGLQWIEGTTLAVLRVPPTAHR